MRTRFTIGLKRSLGLSHSIGGKRSMPPGQVDRYNGVADENFMDRGRWLIAAIPLALFHDGLSLRSAVGRQRPSYSVLSSRELARFGDRYNCHCYTEKEYRGP
jgi:hypothetical protein